MLCLSLGSAQSLQGQCPGDERAADGSEEARGGEGGREGAHCYQSYSAILSSDCLSFPRSERHNIVPAHPHLNQADCKSRSVKVLIFWSSEYSIIFLFSFLWDAILILEYWELTSWEVIGGLLCELELRLIQSTMSNGRNVESKFTNSINLTRCEAKWVQIPRS